MNMTNLQPTGIIGGDEKLPFEPKTLLIGFWLRSWIFLVFAVVATLLAVPIAKKMGSKTFVAETVMLYKPSAMGVESEKNEALPVDTLMHMVKVRKNLEEVQRRLNLVANTSVVGYACDVNVQEMTTLMLIQCYWDDNATAAALANTLRDVFLENITMVHLSTIDKIYDETVRTRETLHSQSEEVKRMIHELKKGGDEDTQTLGQKSLKDSSAQKKLEAMQRKVQQDEKSRSDMSALSEAQLAYENARKLQQFGAISETEVKRIKRMYDKQKDIVGQSQKLKKLQNSISSGSGMGADDESDKMLLTRLEDMKKKSIDLQLQEVALDEKIHYLSNLHKEILEGRFSSAKGQKDFTVISEAQVPVSPTHSTTKMIFMAVTAVGSMAGLFLAILLTVFDIRVKSSAELVHKFSMPVLGVLPKAPSRQKIKPAEEGSPMLEAFKITARKIRSMVPGRGARVLIVSTRPGEGKTMVATNLAACLGRQDERVLLVDANIRYPGGPEAAGDLLLSEQGPVKGLGEYLSFEADTVDEIIWPTRLPGVECVPRVGKAVMADLLGSHRMRDFMEECSNRYGIVLVDSPPLQSFVDGELLAQWADAIIYVVQGQTVKTSQISRVLERLKSSKALMLGFIMNRVDKFFLEVQ